VPTVLKSGILSVLVPSGPLQGCTGIALLLRYLLAITAYFLSLIHNILFRKRNKTLEIRFFDLPGRYAVQADSYSGTDKSLVRSGRKQATATEDFDFHISYL
jgi:hypothetical protein